MPQTIDIPDVGPVDFPDDAKPEEIQSFLDENFNKTKTSALGAFGRSAVTGAGPGAAFIAGMPYGAEMGAGLGPVGAGIGSLISGGVAAYGAHKLQDAALKAVLPEKFKQLQQYQQADVEQHPYATGLGDIASLGTSAKMAPFKLAQIPFRAALGAGLTTAQSLATERKLPSARDLAVGTAQATIFGEPRFGKGVAHGAEAAEPRPEASPEDRTARESLMLSEAKKLGRDWKITDEPFKDRPNDVAQTDDEGNVTVHRDNLHKFLETYTGVKPEEAIKDLVNHETLHGLTMELPEARDKVIEFWKDMTPLEQAIFKKLIPGSEGKPDAYLGKEASRFMMQRAGGDASEFLELTRGMRLRNRVLGHMLDAVQAVRRGMKTDASARQKELINKVVSNFELAKKGAYDAGSVTSPESVAEREVRPPVGEETPLRQQGEAAPAQAEAAPVAQAAQISLKPTTDRSKVLLKDVPVVKDAAAGSIPPDQLIPAIRLINGDVVHGWVKKNGKVSTHPEIAKKYGIGHDEWDRKGFVTRDGKAFVEREPAAAGTQLPTGKKEGELHSTDLPEKAPPVTKAQGAPVAAPAPVKGETAAVPKAVAAEPPISRPTPRPYTAQGPVAPKPTTNPEILAILGQMRRDRSAGKSPDPALLTRYDELTEINKPHKTETAAMAMREGQEPPKDPNEENLKAWLDKVMPVPAEVHGKSLEDRQAYVTGVAKIISELHPDQREAAYETVIRDAENAHEQIEHERDKLYAPRGQAEAKANIHRFLNKTWGPVRVKMGEKAEEKEAIRQSGKSVGGEPVLEKYLADIPKAGAQRPEAIKMRYETPSFDKWWSTYIKPKLQLTKAEQILMQRLEAQDPEHRKFTLPEEFKNKEYCQLLWNDSIDEFLTNASADKLAELRRVHGLETKRFRGVLADPDPDPILASLRRSASIDPKLGPQWTLFDAFATSHNITRDQAEKFLRDASTRQAADIVSAVLPKGKPITEVEQKARIAEHTRGQKFIRKRTDSLRNELHRRMVEEYRTPDKDPLRSKFGTDDIWFNNSHAERTYRQFAEAETHNHDWIEGQITDEAGSGQNTHRVTILKNRTTGEMDAVSTFKDHGKTYLYDPKTEPGDKTGGNVRLIGEDPEKSTTLGTHQVFATALLREPVRNFHQRWSSEAEYLSDVGDHAKGVSESVTDADWDHYNKQEPVEPEEKKLSPAEEEKRAVARKRMEEKERKYGEKEPELPEPLEEGEAPRGFGRVTETSDPEELRARAGTTASEEARMSEAMSNYLRGPAGLLRTKLHQMVRGPLTGTESTSVFRFFERWKPHIKDIFDVEPILRDIQRQAKRIDPTTKRPYGLRGKNYAFISAMSKAARNWLNHLMTSPSVKETLRSLKGKEDPEMLIKGQVKGLTGDALHHYALASKVYLQDKAYEAWGCALQDFYETYKENREVDKDKPVGPDGITGPERAFRNAALQTYGDSTRRDVERTSRKLDAQAAERRIRSAIAGAPPSKPTTPGSTMIPPEVGQPLRKGVFRPPDAPPANRMRVGQTESPPATERGQRYQEVVRNNMLYEEGYMQKKLLEAKAEGKVPPGAKMNVTPAEFGRLESKRIGVSEEAAMTMRQHGISDKARKQMEDLGKVVINIEGEPVIKEPDAMSVAEVIKQGEDLFFQGHVPEEVMQMVEQGGRLNDKDIALCRYRDYLLVEHADQIRETLGKGPEWEKANLKWRRWTKRLQNAMQKSWAKSGHAQQGIQHIPSGNFTRNVKIFEDAKGGKINEAEMTFTVGISKKLKQAEQEVVAKENGLTETMKNEDPEGKLDQDNQNVVDATKAKDDSGYDQKLEAFKRRHPKGAPMSMRPGEPGAPPENVDPQDWDFMIHHGARKMINLSLEGGYSEEAWREAVLKDETVGELIPPHMLDALHQASTAYRNRLIAQAVGLDLATAPARKRMTRRLPSIEKCVDVIHNAMRMDPKGKDISAPESYHLWSFIKQKYMTEKPKDDVWPTFEQIVAKASDELGMKQDRVYRALTAKKTFREQTREMYDASRRQREVLTQARNFERNLRYPKLQQFARRIPRWFFMDKILGHGFVGMITHASPMLFNPYATKAYINGWRDMYKFGNPFGDPLYHQRAMSDIQNHVRYPMWIKAELQINPFKFSDDYSIANLNKFFRVTAGGKGFDALKTVRLEQAERMWSKLRPGLQTQAMADQIAQGVNHMTGIIRGSGAIPIPGLSPEASSWMFFAPKLMMSQFAFLFKDPIRAASILARGSKATAPEHYWAMSELKQKAAIVATYAGFLALNQGLLSASGEKQKVNMTDPHRSDFWQFKVGGFRVGVAGPLIGIVRLVADMLRIGYGHRTSFEKLKTKQEEMGEELWKYGRGKLSPFASFGVDVFSREDYQGRPLPWSKEKVPAWQARRGMRKYTAGEYIGETFSPIFIEEAVREVFRREGMSPGQSDKTIRALISASATAATGARVTGDQFAGRH